MKTARQKQISHKGFTLIEIMVVITILSLIIMGVYTVLQIGQRSWFDTEASIQIQQSVRQMLQRITQELQKSGRDKDGILQVTVFDGTGVNNTDIIRFSIPVVCESTASIIDTNGDVAYWRAPLTWGCTDSSCMDADDDCVTIDYKYVEYLINSSNQLIRRVLDNSLSSVREDIFSNSIIDFQIPLTGDMITLQVTAQIQSVTNRTLTTTEQINVFLRNGG